VKSIRVIKKVRKIYIKSMLWGVKLTTHLHLEPRSRMRGAIPPLPQNVFMAWCLVKHRDNFTILLLLAHVLKTCSAMMLTHVLLNSVEVDKFGSESHLIGP
jgi:hypothetical protein